MRLYLDTSVLGAVLDEDPPGRKETTLTFLRLAERRRDALYVSDVVLDEIARSPSELRLSLTEILGRVRPMVLSESPETLALAQAYVSDRVVPPRFRDDARHVAVTTVAAVEALVSWNFRHLVNLRRKRMFHSVNLRMGYHLIDLVSPEEVLHA